MTVNIETTQTFQNLLESNHRISQHIGGTRSGKTYAILQYLIVKGIESKQTITIVRRTIPSLKRTLIKDFKDIMQSIGIWVDDRFNIADRTYTFDNDVNIEVERMNGWSLGDKINENIKNRINERDNIKNSI